MVCLDLERMKRMQRLKEGYQEISASFKAGPITCLFPCRTTIFEVHHFYREKKVRFITIYNKLS